MAVSVASALQSAAPYVQGYELALWLRDELHLSDGPVDPASLLTQWNVADGELSPLPEQLDAIAFWGDNHGPGVLTNPDGLYAQSPAGLKATLAHELAHLILDRKDALPAAEVLGGSTPHHVEQRARAFAAELPTRDRDVEELVERVHAKVLGLLRRRGLLVDEDADYDPGNSCVDDPVLASCYEHSLRVPQQRLSMAPPRPGSKPVSKSRRCAKFGPELVGGFSKLTLAWLLEQFDVEAIAGLTHLEDDLVKRLVRFKGRLIEHLTSRP